MEDDLISKKELLDITGISYGQLYRWKRKQLIPEEWFIRKATFTGQETFFPKEMILARIHNIVNMKDDLSLDELANRLSDSSAYDRVTIAATELIKRNIVSLTTMNKFGGGQTSEQEYTYDQIIHLVAVDRLLSTGDLNLAEAELLFRTLSEKTARFEGKGWELFFVRKMGVTSFILALAPAELIFDEGVRLISRLALGDLREQLKGMLTYKLI
ncbi:YhbD family protein [Paenibacillus sp. 19GGS1-52]|uniref:YhbD family protein n=1 Tax=Paenibacillus sp. 19GGS1-52 TaxID=2758563 RepID=UPI001EFA4284|nr:YhbD family protein [Paenibacillus sp. 19GGS1-52]ULO09413.1 YhbD family protein [Paenibacillus sp. 19GGS1-52]